MLKSKGKTCMVEEPPHVKQLSLNHVCKKGLIGTFIKKGNLLLRFPFLIIFVTLWKETTEQAEGPKRQKENY
jgi:hypothetical protein